MSILDWGGGDVATCIENRMMGCLGITIGIMIMLITHIGF
jgi:hypothetical protein